MAITEMPAGRADRHHPPSSLVGTDPAGKVLSPVSAGASASVLCSQQAAPCPASTGNVGGSSAEQIGIACGQRGWKRQPVGGLTSDGGAPAAPSQGFSSLCGSGAALSSSWVYGCCGA